MKEVKVYSVDVSYKGRYTTIQVMADNAHAAREKARQQSKDEGLRDATCSWPILVEEYVLA